MKKQIKAFTLIETIIAISVFCIGILAALTWITKTLRNQDYANTQIKSAFFAREGIELMFNLRDSNYRKELPRNCIFRPATITSSNIDENLLDKEFCVWYFWSWSNNSILKISLSPDDYIYVETWSLWGDFETDFNNFQIYFHNSWSIIGEETWFIYDYTWNDDEKTRFAKYLIITGVTEWSTNIDTDKLLKIESHVLYKKWTLTWEKIMETFMWNYEF